MKMQVMKRMFLFIQKIKANAIKIIPIAWLLNIFNIYSVFIYVKNEIIKYLTTWQFMKLRHRRREINIE